MDQTQPILFFLFLIFTGTAILSTIALLTRQSLLVAYMILGIFFGPWGLKLIQDSALIQGTGNIGIIFLLFLLGLNLQPQNLLHSLLKMSRITVVSSLFFMLLGFLICRLFQYDVKDSIIIGITMMFSSTIIGIKLLPTTALHHQRTGELMVSILLLQDLIAIAALLIIQLVYNHQLALVEFNLTLCSLPILIVTAFVLQRYVLATLFVLFSKVHEYIFILSIGWCLFMATMSHILGLSEAIGAFLAGISLASNPISLYVAESLKPLRDFFLVIFFFTIGASFNFTYLPTVAIPALTLAAAMLIVKPAIFSWLLHQSGERKAIAQEVGIRLGQLSEFSLLIVFLALQTKLFSETTTFMIQAATVFTFIVSCYWVALNYPTPLAPIDSLRRD